MIWDIGCFRSKDCRHALPTSTRIEKDRIMQIVESSFEALRSARIALVSDTCAARITLFPMVHVGEPAFFDQVETDALPMTSFLSSGFRGAMPAA